MHINKHAYLVIAHNEPSILQATVTMLDDARNDFFLLIDKKSDIGMFKSLHAKYANIYFVRNRINIKWGTISQVKAEIKLMKEAINLPDADRYTLFHIISGVDLPLMSTDEIFEADYHENGKNFITFDNDEANVYDALFKTKYYHFLPNLRKSRHLSVRTLSKIFSSVSIAIQRLLMIERIHSLPIKKGPNWCSIRPNLIKHIIKNEGLILSEFKYTSCPDEMFVQSLIYGKSREFPISDYGCMRLIDWNRGKPYIFRSDDFQLLTRSTCFFARKFSTFIDSGIIEAIRNHHEG